MGIPYAKVADWGLEEMTWNLSENLLFQSTVSINICSSSESVTLISCTASLVLLPKSTAHSKNGARLLLSWKMNVFEAFPPRTSPCLLTSVTFLFTQSKLVAFLTYRHLPILCCQKVSALLFFYLPLIFPSVPPCVLRLSLGSPFYALPSPNAAHMVPI